MSGISRKFIPIETNEKESSPKPSPAGKGDHEVVDEENLKHKQILMTKIH